MRLRPFPLVAFGLLSVFAFALPQNEDAAKLIELGKTDSRVMEHLDHLSNRIGPRLTGSDNLQNACEWTREQFESFGLQNCRLEKWGEFPVAFNRGPQSGRMLAPEVKELRFGTNSWTAGTKGNVSGLAVLAPTNDEELDRALWKLKGAWVIVPPTPARPTAPRPAPPQANASESGARASDVIEASASTAPPAGARPQRAPAPDRAFRDKLEKIYDQEGILGTIRGVRGELIVTSGNSRISFDKLPKRPAISMVAADHQDIVDKLKAGEEVRLEFDIRNWFEKGPVELFNVIAEIPGSDKADEVVVVGGHIDTWDGATGATDNGTGCSTTLEAARLIVKAGIQPRRTIRFMLWSGEEQGLLGSAAYVKAHKDEMEKISAVLVHDEGTNYCAGLPTTPAMKPQLDQVFAPIVGLDPDMPFKLREQKTGLTGGGSDHASFLSANVPGFFWDQKGRANYTHTHHTQFDTYDMAIPEYQKNSAIVIAVGAVGIANLPEMLSREKLRATGGGGGFGGRRLGVQLADDMTIDEVVEESLAAKAGIKAGDKIVRIGEKVVADNEEMRTALREGPAKNKVFVLRAGKEMEFPIEFPPDTGAGGFGRRLGLRFAEGAVIDDVTADGAAEKAGFKVGDKVVKIGETKVEALADLARAFTDAGDKPQIVVKRDGTDVTLTLTLPERP